MTRKNNSPAKLTYAGNRPFTEIKATVQKNTWPWVQDKFDKGSDYVTFGFMGSDSQRREIIYNPFNGTFIVEVEGDLETESSTHLDGETWYRELLDFLYVKKISRRKPAAA